MDTRPRLGADEQPAPAPAPKEPAGDRDGLAVVVAAVALLLALCLGSTRPATPWGQLLRACGRLRPLHPTTYIPGWLAVFDRNPDWDAASDPLRKVWVDRIQVTLHRSPRPPSCGAGTGDTVERRLAVPRRLPPGAQSASRFGP
jgi:hypothetical protein